MNSVLLNHIGRFILVILLQVLILNNIQVSGYINPYFYIFFLLLLPMDMPRLAELLLGFALGFTIDLFTHTIGMHTAATVFLAFCRPYVLKYMAPREGYEFTDRPTIQDQGLAWFLSYAGILILLHHLSLFFIEMYRFSAFFQTLGRALLSGAFTLLLILIAQYLTYREKRDS